MLEAGITFSFGQLIIDDCIVKNIKKIMAKDALLSSSPLDMPSDIHDFVSHYIAGEANQAKYDPKTLKIAPENECSKELYAKSHVIADEIISSHRVDPVDPVVKKEMRRIVESAE